MNIMDGLPGAPITLVVKAPNQKLGDQTIECFLDWTVKRLKTHLAAVYPSKPTEKNQRIIYSGKLLQDNVILKDVLRQHDDTRQHTVHLVCSLTDDLASTCSSSPVSNTTTSHSSSSTTTTAEPNANTPHLRRSSTSAAIHSHNPSSSNSDGLRHRLHHSVSFPNFYQYGYNGNYPMQQYAQGQGQGYVPNAQHAYWMQQMYAQQMAQYMQYSSQYTTASMLHTNVPPPATPSAVPQPPANHNLAAPPAANPAPVPPAPNPAAPANQNMRMNAGVGAAVDDDEQEGGNRDWLDWIYTFCRMGVLLSIVYFYSSLNRFLVVISAMVFIYLYQGGWFRLERGRPGVRDAAQDGAAGDQQSAKEAEEAQQGEDQPNNNTDEADATDNADDAETEETTEDDSNETDEDAAPDEPPPPGVLGTAWVFVSTFFTSLLPMDPAANMAN